MITTVEDYVTAVREVLQEPSPRIWTAAQILRYLNWAKDAVFRFWVLGCQGDWKITVDSATSLVASQQEYDLPSDMVRFVDLERVHQNQDFMHKIPSRRDRASYESVSSGARTPTYPKFYYVAFPKFGICPTPAQAITDAVKVHYIAKLTDMTAGSWTEFSSTGIELLERLTVFRAAMFAKHIDESADSSLAAEFRMGQLELLQDYTAEGEQESMRRPASDGW